MISLVYDPFSQQITKRNGHAEDGTARRKSEEFRPGGCRMLSKSCKMRILCDVNACLMGEKKSLHEKASEE